MDRKRWVVYLWIGNKIGRVIVRATDRYDAQEQAIEVVEEAGQIHGAVMSIRQEK